MVSQLSHHTNKDVHWRVRVNGYTMVFEKKGEPHEHSISYMNEIDVRRAESESERKMWTTTFNQITSIVSNMKIITLTTHHHRAVTRGEHLFTVFSSLK